MRKRVAVMGGGPAGLMAAEALLEAGCAVDLFDAMPSVGRKFLLAGIGGLNLTHAEPWDAFVQRYGTEQNWVAPWLDRLGPAGLRAWCAELGISTFVGSSGRVFPEGMKAAPLLRAWLQRLRRQGLRVHTRHRWLGWTEEGAIRIAAGETESCLYYDAQILALGGASWPRLGSDASWVPELRRYAVDVQAFRPANCGFELNWSEPLQRHAGQPLNAVTLRFEGGDEVWHERRGSLIVSHYGLEGGLIYALSRPLRERIERDGQAWIELDLLPDRSLAALTELVAAPRGKKSLSSHLKSKLKLSALKLSLLYEVLPPADRDNPYVIAGLLKRLPLLCLRPRPLAEAISTAGGIPRHELNEGLMLKRLPGIFCAGEMLDWEAPTGGYLLTACLASGRVAGEAAAHYLSRLSSQ